MAIKCPHCGHLNAFPTGTTCKHCGEDMAMDHAAVRDKPNPEIDVNKIRSWGQLGKPDTVLESIADELRDIAVAMDRTATATERIYNLMMAVVVVSALVGIVLAIWSLTMLP